MKKAFFLGGVALIMIALMGCDDKEIIEIITGGDEPDAPTVISGNWDKILSDFEVQAGENPGEIQYKFSGITNDTAVVYTLYYIPQPINSALLIIAANQNVVVTPESTLKTLDFTFLAGLTYSMVIEARKGTDLARSGVKQVKTKAGPSQLQLTVTGTIPSGITIAKLLTDSTATPLATGSNMSGTFRFFNASNQIFKQTGEYLIYLENANGTTRYKYMGDGSSEIKFNFTDNPTPTIDIGKFKQ
jgi:hypothetical protein